jgi:hypothetical protein
MWLELTFRVTWIRKDPFKMTSSLAVKVQDSKEFAFVSSSNLKLRHPRQTKNATNSQKKKKRELKVINLKGVEN